ncbi:Retrovirus-related Pol polyprotein from transposon TNT 1-94, partial [Trichinella sp. T9]
MGIKVLSDGSIFAGQQAYTRHILERFRLDEANAISTPAEINVSMEENEEHLTTRPDIAYAVSTVSQVMDKPSIKAWPAVKRIFRYLRGTADYGLLNQAKREGFMKVYSDADYAGDVGRIW